MNYYKVLGLKEGVTKEQIKTAYRKAAKQYHPDLNKDDPNAAERFKEIQEAYDVLYNGKQPTMQPQIAQPSGRRPFNYEEFMKRRETTIEYDKRTSLSTTIKDYLYGGESIITLDDGRKLTIKIPAGKGPGFILRSKGFGLQKPDKSFGDLFLEIKEIRLPKNFRFEDGLLIYDLNINPFEALVGRAISISIPGKEPFEWHLSPCLKDGSKFRIKITEEGGFYVKINVIEDKHVNLVTILEVKNFFKEKGLIEE